MSELPEPLTPADCDLRGYGYMPLFGHRLFNSDFELEATDLQFRVAIKLWWAAWQQCPAGSIPGNEAAQARLVGVHWRSWKSLAPVLLRSWTKCADGRLYHPLLCEAAKEAYARRLKDRERKRKHRELKETPEPCHAGQDAEVTRDETRMSQGRHADVPPLNRTEQKIREEEKEEPPLRSPLEPEPTAAPSARPTRGCRLPDDWNPGSDGRKFALGLGIAAPEQTFAKFCDYWRSKSGQAATKLDWDATWRNWCRTEADRRPRAGLVQQFRNGFIGIIAEDGFAARAAAESEDAGFASMLSIPYAKH